MCPDIHRFIRPNKQTIEKTTYLRFSMCKEYIIVLVLFLHNNKNRNDSRPNGRIYLGVNLGTLDIYT